MRHDRLRKELSVKKWFNLEPEIFKIYIGAVCTSFNMFYCKIYEKKEILSLCNYKGSGEKDLLAAS